MHHRRTPGLKLINAISGPGQGGGSIWGQSFVIYPVILKWFELTVPHWKLCWTYPSDKSLLLASQRSEIELENIRKVAHPMTLTQSCSIYQSMARLILRYTGGMCYVPASLPGSSESFSSNSNLHGFLSQWRHPNFHILGCWPVSSCLVVVVPLSSQLQDVGQSTKGWTTRLCASRLCSNCGTSIIVPPLLWIRGIDCIVPFSVSTKAGSWTIQWQIPVSHI